VQGDHVGVALDDARAILPRDRRPRLVEPVDDRALAEELRLGRVHVLRFQRVVVVQTPRLEAERTAARVGEREEKAAGEVVVTALPRQAGGPQLFAREALCERLPRERVADFAADVDERLDDERQMRAALRALQKLPRADQDVLALCVWEELTYEQAARALGVPVGTVRSRLSRARARLRELASNPGHEWDERFVTEETS
jgi:RNA polymerase sigma factor (sigma-70 family)